MASLPSQWSEWLTTLIPHSTVDAPSWWTNWLTTTVWDDASALPSDWSDWEHAQVWFDPGYNAFLRTTTGTWVPLGSTTRRTPSGLWVPQTGIGTPNPEDELWPPILLGASVSVPETFDSFNADCVNDGSKPGAANDGLAVYRTFSGVGPPADFMATEAAPDVDNNVASIWSCKPPLTEAHDGLWDATFRSLFNSIPAGHRAFLAMWHEPRGNGFDWGVYRRAQARIWHILQNSNADLDLVKWGIIATRFNFEKGHVFDFFPYGGEYDFVGVDAYDRYRNLSVDPEGPPPAKYYNPIGLFGRAVEFAVEQGKPLVVAEMGMHPDPTNLSGGPNNEGVPSRPQRFQNAMEYLSEYNVAAVSYYQSWRGGAGPWWIDVMHNYDDPLDRSTPDTASMAMFRDYLAMYGKNGTATS